MVAYNDYHAAEDEQLKKTCLADMKKVIKTQIAEIKEKYLTLDELNTPGFAIMFIPIESAWFLAREQFPELFEQALTNKVVICGSTTMFATLLLVEQIWRDERIAANVQAIGQSATKLHQQTEKTFRKSK